MPYPNEHAARITPPSGYDRFTRSDKTNTPKSSPLWPIVSSGISVILGWKGGKSEIQAFRFPTDKFTEAQAREWLKSNDVKFISFEPAAEVKKTFDIIKRDEEKRLVYGIVYEPETVDAHGDIASAEAIEKAAHDFLPELIRKDSSGLNMMHDKPLDNSQAAIVESYIQKEDGKIGDQAIKKGTWILTTKIYSDPLWEDIKAGKYNGYSMEGSANAAAE